MLLCLDVGNSHILGGIFVGKELKLRFRYPSNSTETSDQMGVFFKHVLRENNIDPSAITAIALCSVVPSLDYSLTSACIKYFNIRPFVLKPGVKTGLKLIIKSPQELGADRVATSIAAIEQFPDRNIILLDFGTATTLCALSKNKEYLGGAILAGIKTSMQALYQAAAKLAPVDIVTPPNSLGKTTEHQVQAGLFYGQLGAVKEIITRLKHDAFPDEDVMVIGTGGFSHLYEDQGVFDLGISNLVLHGLQVAWHKNQITEKA